MNRITRSPLLSTFGILAAGSLFAFAIYSFYPESDAVEEVVPVIKAEVAPIKIEPARMGGMEIPFEDSTVYDSQRRADINRASRVENLLEPASGDEEPMSRAEISARLEAQSSDAPKINITEDITADMVETVAEVNKSDAGAEEIAAKPIRNILEDVPEEKTAQSNETQNTSKVVPAERVVIHQPAASPETLAFVRSVLDKKDAEAIKAKNTGDVPVASAAPEPVRAEAIEPAAGTEGNIITKGTHYVQLASISDKGRADGEWEKLKAEFSAAIPSASSFRVQEANLAKGTFFRIQAGPYSKQQAQDICESIKTQKPGGCLVVQ
ncbi:MAG: SPOR domain-containing protein [Alphaproteobacteria bacterium]